MGVDACIAIKAHRNFDHYPIGCTLHDIPDNERQFYPKGATHYLSTPWRYYGKGYERGPWPEICATIMRLVAYEAERVWYYGDSGPFDEADEMTPERVCEISKYYMQYGNEPYYKSFR